MKKILLALIFCLISGIALAKPVKVFVGTPAGSGSDIQTRKLFDGVSKITGDNYIVINKPGANFLLSYNAFIEEVASGNTAILYNASTLSITLNSKNIEPELKGLIPLHKVHYFVAVRADSTIKNISDINIGTTSLVSDLLVKTFLKGNTNIIPYKSENESSLALLRGDVDAISTHSLNSVVVSQPDKFKIINAYPHTIFGITGFSVSNTMPESERVYLNQAMNKVMKSEEYSSWLKATFNIDVEGGGPDTYDDLDKRLISKVFNKLGK